MPEVTRHGLHEAFRFQYGRSHTSSWGSVNFHILGPLEVLHDGHAVDLGASKERALLALLILHANETLSADRLIDELWDGRQPATAAKTLQVYVSRLRKALTAGCRDSAGLIVTRGHGYVLDIDPDSVDARRFELLVAEGSRELAASHPERAATLLERAVALWRGTALCDLAYEPFAQREIARLGDLRVEALEELIDAKLALGRHVEALPELEALTADHPYRERPPAQLMLALYRSERQADALQAYQDVRRKLDEVGLEPGEHLRELEHAILLQDPALAIARRSAATPDAAGLHDRVAEVADRLADLYDRLGESDEAARARADADAERRTAAHERGRPD